MAKLNRELLRRQREGRESAEGEKLFAQGQVHICGVNGSLIVCAVGQGGDSEVVLLDLEDLSFGEISIACGCSGPLPFTVCRHIYAASREAQDSIIRPLMPELRQVEMSFDEELYYELDEYSVDELMEQQFGVAPATIANNTFALQVRLSENKSTSLYERFENAVRRNNDQEIVPWYIFDVAASSLADTIVIQTVQGTLEQPGELPLTRADVRRMPVDFNNDDRLLWTLLSLDHDDETEFAANTWDVHPENSGAASYALAEVHPLLIQLLDRTGRAHWMLDPLMDRQDARSLSFRPDAGFELQLLVKDQPDRAGWSIEAYLSNGERTLLPSDATCLLSSGVMLFEDELSIIDWKGASEYRRLFVTQTELFARYHERRELIEFLSRLPAAVCQPWPDSLLEVSQRVTPQPIIRLGTIDQGMHNQLGGTIAFRYAEGVEVGPTDTETIIEDDISDICFARDLEFETSCYEQLATFGSLAPGTSAYEGFHMLFPSRRLFAIAEFLIERQWIVEWQGKRFRNLSKASFSVSSGTDWFDLNADIDFDDVPAKLPALLAAARDRKSWVELSDGSRGLMPTHLIDQIQRLSQLGRHEESSVRFAPSQALLIDSLLSHTDHSVFTDGFFDRFTSKLRRFQGVKPKTPPRSFQGELRPYQQVGLGWLHFLKEFHLGGCLADDMGLGKTIQVLCLLESRRVRRLKNGESRLPSLVVVPKSLVFNWLEEAQRFVPQLRIRAYHGNDRVITLEGASFDVLVTTYGTMRTDIERLADLDFDYVVLDEAQAIKNPMSQTARASRVLRANHRLALTGTPIENHLGELWSIFEFLNPGILGTTSAFKTLTTATNQDADTLSMIRDTVAPFILRRTKEVVLDDLPEKSEQVLYCQLDSKQRRLYDQLKNYYRKSLDNRVREVGMAKSKIHVLEALLRLRQVACHPALVDEKYHRMPSAKLDSLIEQLTEVRSEGHRALVFSQFTGFLDLIRKRLDKLKIQYCYLDGATQQRGRVVKQFQEDESYSVFLISLKAGGHGLNLTSADYVFLMDPWWNPAVEAQAIDRAHRIGQKRAVFAYRMIARDTVEERILELQGKKKDLAEAIISNNQSLLQKLSAEDLRRLLS